MNDLKQDLSDALKGILATRHGYPVGGLDALCTVESYVDDASLLARLDNNPPNMDDDGTAGYVRDLRTALKWVYKLRAPCSTDQYEEAINAFVARNDSATKWRLRVDVGAGWSESKLGRVMLLAQQLVRHVTAGYQIGKPCHGPGTSYYRYRLLFEKYAYLERDVPDLVWKRFSDFFKPSPQSDTIDPFDLKENSCRLACVPKDVRGPRLVAPHMASAVWVQQAVLEGIEESVLNHPCFWSYWPGEDRVRSVSLRDQSINQRLARYASANPSMYATLDLKDASDLISWRLVCYLFSGTTLLRDLWAIRARTIRLPDGRTLKLGMHAPMGSAVCFPVMALTLWALGTATMYVLDHEWCRYRPTSKEFWARAKPFVFGDDVIIGVQYVQAFKTILTLCGLRCNEKKSFSGPGGFRESCGTDWYRGRLVTPLMLRRDDIDCIEGYTSLISLYNSLVREGYEEVSEVLLRHLIARNRFEKNGASWLAFTAREGSHGILVREGPLSARYAYQLNKRIGALQRRNRNTRAMEVLTHTLVPVSRTRVPEVTDSRARLYEALACGHRRETEITSLRPRDASFGWALERTRAVSCWSIVFD